MFGRLRPSHPIQNARRLIPDKLNELVRVRFSFRCCLTLRLVPLRHGSGPYDGSKTVNVSGTIASVNYSNPHIFFSIDGGSRDWTVETEGVSVAIARGLTPTVLKEGAKVTATGWPARDGTAKMGLKSISITGGPTVTTRSTAR